MLKSHAMLFILCAMQGLPASAGEIDYQPAPGFLKLPEGWKLGACSAVAINSRGELHLFHRGEHPLICFDAQGNYLQSWAEVNNRDGLLSPGLSGTLTIAPE